LPVALRQRRFVATRAPMRSVEMGSHAPDGGGGTRGSCSRSNTCEPHWRSRGCWQELVERFVSSVSMSSPSAAPELQLGDLSREIAIRADQWSWW
jgi:hypothetical protein